tara:strand:+ start:65 stop:328 length:264 start_codon:yes stop_codon:yes gene_type:complete
VLYHADLHDVHNVRVTLKRKVIPEVRIAGSIASHAYDLLDNVRTKLRVIAHKLRDKDREIIVTVAQDVSENVTDEGREGSEHCVFHY